MTRRRPDSAWGGPMVGALLLGLAGDVAAKVTVVAAKAQIEMIGTALDTFRRDVCRFPTDDEGLRVLSEASRNVRDEQ